MARDVRRAGKPGIDPSLVVLCIIAAAVVAIGVVIATTVNITAWLTGSTPSGWNPLTALLNAATGRLEWTMTTTIVLAVILGVLAVAIAAAVSWAIARKNSGKRVDDVQKLLADSSDIASLSRESAQKTAERFMPADLAASHPGLRFGHVPGKPKKGLYSTWEDLYLVIFGPRMGKTTSQVIPAIVDAPGAVVTTSNKRDIIDDTIGITGARGPVWVFDPQNIAAGFDQNPWFFDPLDMVRADPAKMDSSADRLADIFLSASRSGDGGGEAYWEQMGRQLLASMFLAAAVDNLPIGEVYQWVNDPDDRTPLMILEQHPEWSQRAAGLMGTYSTTEVTRSGFFSQAAQMAAPLGRAEALKWVNPAAGATRFSAEDFVRSTDQTMYLLSKEGADNAAALTTALTAAIMTAAEKYGESQGGRMPVPLVAALDEAANVVQWPELPGLYSHYGSRSIILMTILQSYAQGVKCWGEQGMEALWSASNVTLYGGGVRDEKLLQKMEALIGDAAEAQKSVSRSSAGRSSSTSWQEKKILTVADLAALQSGRAVAFVSKRRPMIVETEPFWERDWDQSVRDRLNIRA